jgi:hypothetical protein
MLKKFKDRKLEELKKEEVELLSKISPLYHLLLTWTEEIERKEYERKN